MAPVTCSYRQDVTQARYVAGAAAARGVSEAASVALVLIGRDRRHGQRVGRRRARRRERCPRVATGPFIGSLLDRSRRPELAVGVAAAIAGGSAALWSGRHRPLAPRRRRRACCRRSPVRTRSHRRAQRPRHPRRRGDGCDVVGCGRLQRRRSGCPRRHHGCGASRRIRRGDGHHRRAGGDRCRRAPWRRPARRVAFHEPTRCAPGVGGDPAPSRFALRHGGDHVLDRGLRRLCRSRRSCWPSNAITRATTVASS